MAYRIRLLNVTGQGIPSRVAHGTFSTIAQAERSAAQVRLCSANWHPIVEPCPADLEPIQDPFTPVREFCSAP